MSDRSLQLRVLFAAADKFTAPVRKMMGSSKSTGAEVKKLYEHIKRLNDQSAKIDGFRKLSAQTAITSNQFKQAQERLKAMERALVSADRPSAALVRGFEKAHKEANTLKIKLGEMQTKLDSSGKALKTAGIDTKKLGDHQNELADQIAASNKQLEAQKAVLEKTGQASRAMRAARADYDRGLATRDKIAGAGMAAGVAGAATLAVVGKTVSAYAEAENAATKLKTTMMDANGEVGKNFQAINNLATNLGDRLPGTTADFQSMMTMLKRQGLSDENILGGTGEATALLAVQMEMGFERAAEFSAKMQDATRTSEQDMIALMDTINRTYNVGVDPDNMLQGFSKVSGALDIIRMQGLEGAKTIAPLLAMFDQAGMDGSAAGNALRKVLTRSMDTEKVAKGTKGTGVQLDFTDGKGEFGGFQKMFSELQKLKNLTTEQRNAIIKDVYGDDAEVSQVLATMMNKGMAGYEDMQGRMNAQASLQQRVNVSLGTLTNLWDAATGSFQNVMARAGEALSPELKKASEWISEINNRIGNWIERNPELAAGIMKGVAIVGLALAGFAALAAVVATVMGPLLMLKFGFSMLGAQGLSVISIVTKMGSALFKGMSVVGNALLWVGRLAMAHPVLALITALALGALYVWRNWDTIGPKFHALLERIRAAFGAAWDAIQARTSAAVQWVQARLQGIVSWLGGLRASMVQAGADIINGLITGVTSRLDALRSTIVNAASSAAAWFRQKLDIRSPSRVFQLMGRQSLQGYEQGLVAQQGSTAGIVGSIVDRLLGAFPMVRRLIAMGGAALPALATAAMPQIDTRPPLLASAPAMAAQMAGMAAGGSYSAPVINITINAAPGQSEQQLAQLVAREIEKAQRQAAARARGRMADRD